MNKIILAIVGVLLVGALVTVFTINGNSDVSILDNPDLVFLDEDGEQRVLAELKGTPMIINSWATWCPFCVTELPDFLTLADEMGDDKIKVVAISRDRDVQKAVDYAKENNIDQGSMTIWYDPEDKFFKAIGAITMPETIFVNSDGEIIFQKRGFMTLEEMRNRTAEFLLE